MIAIADRRTPVEPNPVEHGRRPVDIRPAHARGTNGLQKTVGSRETGTGR